MATATYVIPDPVYFFEAVTGDPQINYSGNDFRELVGNIFPRPGRLNPFYLIPQQAPTVSWRIAIGNGAAVIGTSLGKYLVQVDGSYSLDLSGFNTAPSTTRTHNVYLGVSDKAFGGTVYQAQFICTEDVSGTGAPTPTGFAALMLLGTVTISPGQANIKTANCTPSVAVTSPGWYSPATNRIALNTGIVDGANGAAPVSAMYKNGQTILQGWVKRSSGAFAAGATYTLGTINQYLAPPATRLLVGASTDSPFTWQCVINSAGALLAVIPAGSTPTYLSLDELSFEIDY